MTTRFQRDLAGNENNMPGSIRRQAGYVVRAVASTILGVLILTPTVGDAEGDPQSKVKVWFVIERNKPYPSNSLQLSVDSKGVLSDTKPISAEMNDAALKRIMRWHASQNKDQCNVVIRIDKKDTPVTVLVGAARRVLAALDPKWHSQVFLLAGGPYSE